MEALRLARILLSLLNAGVGQVWVTAEEKDAYYFVLETEIICIRRSQPAESTADDDRERPFFVIARHVNVLVLPQTEAWDIFDAMVGRAVRDSRSVAQAKRHAFDSLLVWLEARTPNVD